MLLPLLPFCGVNVGGVIAVRVWPASNVLGYPGMEGASLLDEMELVDPLNYADVFALDGTAGFDEQQAESEQGTFYKLKLQLFIPKDAPDVAEAIARLTGGKFVVAYQDGNGLTKLIGTPTEPLRFSADLETGKRATDRNGRPLTFFGEASVPAPFYLHQEIVPGGRRKAFSPGFNFGFS
ncbi:hypothetical protein LJY25_08235 [Hymenobacter sp. BT175]|uniref:hypothetical protein n=1 Tax=Hymenobacter translucens TaxID=2886507 RepID=UPI001D0EA629|nr:hypothetical protein [Hymenobacter translucens]MCC2546430.1 hypothetical protein [Hymenobacter translucens]